MTFEDHIKGWVSFDNQLRLVNNRARELRNQRNNIGSQIMNYVETQNLSNATVKISDGKIRFVETKQSPPISLKHVGGCLGRFIDDTEKVEEIMNYIKQTRDSKYVSEIKRTYSQ